MTDNFQNVFRPPSQLNVTEGNVSENFKKWKRQVEVYMLASGASSKEDETKTAIILHCAGPQVLEIYDQFTWADENDKNDPDKLFEKLESYCNPRKNEVLESHRFWNVQYQEPFDNFLTELRTRASSCNFQEVDRMMRDKIVFTMSGKLQELLLREDKLDLQKAIKVCRAYEQSNKHVKEIRDTASNTASLKVNKIGRPPNVRKQQRSSDSWKPRVRVNNAAATNKSQAPVYSKECKFCGYKHELVKLKCPAWGKTCDKCKGRNHFQSKCKKVHSVSVDSNIYAPDSDNDSWLAAVDTGSKEFVSAVMTVNDVNVRFQLDSAADVNIICKQYVRKDQVSPTKIRLRMWNKSNMNPLGEVLLKMTNPYTGEERDTPFIVVPNGHMCLIGLETIQKMNLMTIHSDRFIAKIDSQPLGDLGEVSLTLDPDVAPKTLPSRKLSLSIQDDVKVQIDQLVDRGVLVPVTEPTKWVSQMAVVKKSNGKLRICIDPQPLNSALMREHYKLPTLDDVLPKLNNAKIFSKLDVKEAYWHVRLDDKSSYLTTMITPFGRYRWSRLPFGLKVSSEIFQRKINETLGDIKGVFTISDDIIVAGCGNSESEAKIDNEQTLKKLHSRCREQNIILNEEKISTGLTEISFHGHLISNKGVKADDTKIKAILDMPAPTDISGVKRLCGMVQYMAKFLPDLASTLEPIRELSRKGITWNWSHECETALNKIKQKLVKSPVLAFYDPAKELVLQVDSSKHGIGAVLLQEGRPVEFASRALKPAERNWAQIEKEALAVLFGLQRFDQYTYGRHVKVENDHKPLSAILNKPLSSAPKRLQDIMMKLFRYDFTFVFVKGVNLIIADTLSRAHLNCENDNAVCRSRIMTVMCSNDIPDARLQEVRTATANDPDLQRLLNLIIEGWPEQKEAVPSGVRHYFDMRDVLSHQDDIILKGEAILIPHSLRNDIKKRLHSAHLGYDSIMRRARGTVFWPGMAKEIKQLVDYCETCQEHKPANQREPLKQHDDGKVPWNKIGTDLFEISGRHYLVTIDYYSNFIEVDHLTSTTSARVISILKKQFARFGVPVTIVSDGGPQFSSKEFELFTHKWGISHVFSSPGHQQANGKAEAAVKIIKTLMIKTLKEGGDQNEALLEQRNTPRQDTGVSPTEMMFGRKTRSMIPCFRKTNEPLGVNKRNTRKKTVKKSYDRRSHELSELNIGQSVYFKLKVGENWRQGKITDKLAKHTYIVKNKNGVTYRRNRVDIRPTQIEVHIRDQSPIRLSADSLTCAPLPLTSSVSIPVTNISDTHTEKGSANNTTHSSIQNNENLVSQSAQQQRSRPKRNLKEPAYLKDYVRY